ncbi:MAG: hypothetical protein Q8R36_05660 [bacterium]|nr:hypothetical protein [bacterium]
MDNKLNFLRPVPSIVLAIVYLIILHFSNNTTITALTTLFIWLISLFYITLGVSTAVSFIKDAALSAYESMYPESSSKEFEKFKEMLEKQEINELLGYNYKGNKFLHFFFGLLWVAGVGTALYFGITPSGIFAFAATLVLEMLMFAQDLRSRKRKL